MQRLVLVSSVLLAAAVSGGAAQAQSTSAHAMIVSGVAGHPGGGVFDCSTSGPQAGVSARFNTGIGLPTEGYSYCGLAGGIKDTGSAAGISTAHQDLTNSFSNGTHLQTADATADFGILKVASTGSYGGDAIGGFAFHAGEGAAVSTDTLPTPGKFVQLGFTIDGSANIAGNSQSLTIFNYQVNSGPIYSIFVSNVIGYGTTTVRGFDGSSFVDLAGFTVTATSITGGDTVYTFLTELPDAPTFDLTLGLYTASYPTPFGGVANGLFSDTVRLSSFQAYDAARNPINFGTLVGASGRLYDANGVHTAVVGGGTVPEPASWALLIGGFGVVGGELRRRRAVGARMPAA